MQYRLGATDGQGHYDRQVAAQIRQARSAPTRAGRVAAGRRLGAVARAQQEQLEAQGRAALSMITLGGTDVAGAVGRDIVKVVKHPARHHRSATVQLGNEWVVQPVRKAVQHPSATNIALGGLAAASIIPAGGAGRAARAIREAGRIGEGAKGARDVEAEVAILKDPDSYAKYGGAAARGELTRQASLRISALRRDAAVAAARGKVRPKPPAEATRTVPPSPPTPVPRVDPLSPEGQVLSAARASRKTYAEQKQLGRVERAKRFGEAKTEFEAAGRGEAGHLAALEKLRSELPKVTFNKLTHLDQHSTDWLLNVVTDHPAPSEGEKISLRHAILRTRAGYVPRPFEVKLVEKAFGPEKAAEFQMPFGRKILHGVSEVANVPRSILASADVSAPFRQALLASVHNPRAFGRNLGPMFKYLVSEKNYQAVMHGIEQHPQFENMLEDGVRFTGLRDLSHREEQFMSNLAEKIPGIGHVVRASSRAYTGFLNKLRADLYADLRRPRTRSGK
jgi:hypothetical protein